MEDIFSGFRERRSKITNPQINHEKNVGLKSKIFYIPNHLLRKEKHLTELSLKGFSFRLLSLFF
jgi:hypothetical protein